MKRTMRVFLVHDDDTIERVAASRFDRLAGRRDPNERWPEHAGKRLRYALLILDQDVDAGDEPQVIHTEFGFMVFDAHGRRDKQSAEKSMHDALDLLGGMFSSDEGNTNVIGEQAFRQRRYKVAHRWEPTDKILSALGQAVAAGTGPTRRARTRRSEASPR